MCSENPNAAEAATKICIKYSKHGRFYLSSTIDCRCIAYFDPMLEQKNYGYQLFSVDTKETDLLIKQKIEVKFVLFSSSQTLW